MPEERTKELPPWHIDSPSSVEQWEEASRSVGLRGPGSMQQAKHMADAAVRALGFVYDQTAPVDIESAILNLKVATLALPGTITYGVEEHTARLWSAHVTALGEKVVGHYLDAPSRALSLACALLVLAQGILSGEPSEEPARCQMCGKPAACLGVYENPDNDPAYACDECCGHGNEDGWCNPVEGPVPTEEHLLDRALGNVLLAFAEQLDASPEVVARIERRRAATRPVAETEPPATEPEPSFHGTEID